MTTNNETFAFTAGKLILSIVGRRRGERIVAATKAAGAPGGTVALGRGTAANAVLEFLGVGDSEKDIVLTLVPAGLARAVLEAVRHACWHDPRGSGVAMQIDVSSIFRNAAQPSTELVRSPSMNESKDHALIACILNRGYADDAMAAARKAGAAGGTILNARGTGREEDVKFFGVTLVPEKEILLIVIESARQTAVLEAIRKLPCLSAPGSGITFSLDVEDFSVLGKRPE
jgi:nitrogen regulatory protein PII